MKWIAAVLTATTFTVHYRLARRGGAANRRYATLVAIGFTIATPVLFALAVVAITVKYAQLLIDELT